MKFINVTLCMVLFLFLGCTDPEYNNPFDPLAEDNNGNQQYYEEITHSPEGSFGGALGSNDVELRVEWVGQVNRVIWYKDNSQHWIDYDVSDNSSILRFNNLQPSDTGMYSFIVEFQEMGQTGMSQGYRVYINDNGSTEKLDISGPDYIEADDRLEIQVEHIAGKSVEWIQWYFEGSPIPTSINPSAGMNTFVIPNVQEENEGNYYCEVKYQGDNDSYTSANHYVQVNSSNSTGGIVFTNNIIDNGLASESDLIDGAYQVYRVVGGEVRMNVNVSETSLNNISYEWYVSNDNGNNWTLAGASSLNGIQINFDGKQCLVTPLQLQHNRILFKCRVEGTVLTNGAIWKDSNIIRLIVEEDQIA